MTNYCVGCGNPLGIVPHVECVEPPLVRDDDQLEIVPDYTWALFNGDTRVTSWVQMHTTLIPGPGVTVTEVRCRIPHGEIRQPFAEHWQSVSIDSTSFSGDEVQSGGMYPTYLPAGASGRVNLAPLPDEHPDSEWHRKDAEDTLIGLICDQIDRANPDLPIEECQAIARDIIQLVRERT